MKLATWKRKWRNGMNNVIARLTRGWEYVCVQSMYGVVAIHYTYCCVFVIYFHLFFCVSGLVLATLGSRTVMCKLRWHYYQIELIGTTACTVFNTGV